jgi:spore maturation protein CgeB
VLVAHNGAEVASLLASLDRRTAARIGRAARERVLRDHTYERRAAQVEEILGAAA